MSNARALIWAQRALNQINIEAIVSSARCARAPLVSAHERSRRAVTSARVKNRVGHERSLFAVSWSTTSARDERLWALMSARAVCAREPSWADILVHERSWALERSAWTLVTSARGASRSWALELTAISTVLLAQLNHLSHLNHLLQFNCFLSVWI